MDYQEIDKRFEHSFGKLPEASYLKTFLHSEISRALKERDEEVRKLIQEFGGENGVFHCNTCTGFMLEALAIKFPAPAESPEVT